MNQDNQYGEDVQRLAELLEKHTGIPRKRVSIFIEELTCVPIMIMSRSTRKVTN